MEWPFVRKSTYTKWVTAHSERTTTNYEKLRDRLALANPAAKLCTEHAAKLRRKAERLKLRVGADVDRVNALHELAAMFEDAASAINPPTRWGVLGSYSDALHEYRERLGAELNR